MNTKQTVLVAAAVSAMMISAPRAHAEGSRPLIVTAPTGTVRIQQALPCGDPVDGTRPIAGGWIEVTPAVVSERVMITLSRVEMFLTPFSVHRACAGIDATAEFSEIGVRLASGVTVAAVAGTGDAAGQYSFTIPKDQFLIYESILDNVGGRQPERAFQKPNEDVTGVIDLRKQTVQIHVALASQLHFRAGCVGDRCAIDVVKDGTQTADIVGAITPPTQDRDGDGRPDVLDNCPLVANPSQSLVATPIFRAPSDVTLYSCRDHSLGTPTAADICHARPVLIKNNAPAQFAVGRNVVTWTGNDGVDPVVGASQTVTIVDTTAPTVSCTSVNPAAFTFQVAGSDDCAGATTLRLGSYTIANGEVIAIQTTAEYGVRLVRSTDGIRHFLVGRGQGVIMATDAAGNAARAVCQ